VAAAFCVRTTPCGRGSIASQFTNLLIWPRVQKMKPFRKSRDSEGKFALSTPQNPLVNATPRELAAIAIKQLQELAAERKKQLATAADPSPKPKPPVLFADESTPTASLPEPPREEHHEKDHEAAAPATEPEPPASLAVQPGPATANLKEPATTLPAESSAPQKSPRRTIRRSSRRRTIASVLPKRELTSLERHQRKCFICKHHDRLGIEADFLNWCHPDDIVKYYQLDDYRGIYRHAQATGLMLRRSMNIRFAAESILECSGKVVPDADAVLRAVKMCAHLDERGGWHNPPSHVIVSSGSQVNVNVVNPPSIPRLQGDSEIEILPPRYGAKIDSEIPNRQMTRLESESK
jgi:hypothetical protein